MKIRRDLTLSGVARKAEAVFEASAAKIDALEQSWNPANGSPVFTVEGKYMSRGWTEWTQGFQFGSAILQFDATDERRFLEMGRRGTVELMARHLTHTGVHDHGFNNISTYGNLLRLWHEKRLSPDEWERDFYEVALKCSGAVQAARWSRTASGGGFIYSFNGPHSLFIDTMRSLRSLAAAHLLGHSLMRDNDRSVSLLSRLIEHARTTVHYSVYYGEGRDIYDQRGRVAHECLFNPNDGNFRCPNSQQGYSAFSTWTRGLAWAICGFAEQLEFIEALGKEDLKEFGAKDEIRKLFVRPAEATSDFYIENSAADGIPYWDTGAPGLENMGDWRVRNADPFNDYEPVDSSAAVIAAQGFLRLGRFLNRQEYWQAGLTIAAAAFDTPYLSTDERHQGLILHAVYHRPNGWDHIPQGRKIPCGEACMWGDYHACELALYILRLDRNQPYLTFWSNSKR